MTQYAPINAITRKPYSGKNILILTEAAKALGRTDDPRWLTFLQAKELGGHVKKGAKGTQIQFAKADEYTDTEGKKQRRFTHRVYTVFHASQVTGFKPYIA